LDAREWWDYFRKEFELARREPRSEIGIAYNWAKLGRESEPSDTAWTAFLGVFLARLAVQGGFIQRWEVERIPGPSQLGTGALDFGWYVGRNRHPLIVIELESDFGREARSVGRAKVYRKILPKFVGGTDAPLRILLTYIDPREPVDTTVAEFAELIGSMTTTDSRRTEWILGLGPYGWTDEETWRGFLVRTGAEKSGPTRLS
jgi:hypothetical protein